MYVNQRLSWSWWSCFGEAGWLGGNVHLPAERRAVNWTVFAFRSLPPPRFYELQSGWLLWQRRYSAAPTRSFTARGRRVEFTDGVMRRWVHVQVEECSLIKAAESRNDAFLLSEVNQEEEIPPNLEKQKQHVDEMMSRQTEKWAQTPPQTPKLNSDTSLRACCMAAVLDRACWSCNAWKKSTKSEWKHPF